MKRAFAVFVILSAASALFAKEVSGKKLEGKNDPAVCRMA